MFAVQAEPKTKTIERRKGRQVLEPRQKTKNAVEHDNDGDNYCNWHAWNGSRRLWEVDGIIGKMGDEWMPSKLQHGWELQENREENWNPKDAVKLVLQ